MMKKLATMILTVIALALSCSAENTPAPPKPRHCSVAHGDGKVPYPDSLKGSGIQGTVLLQATIGSNGCALGVNVVRKLNPELDKLAKQAVNSWKFTPFEKDGHPTPSIVEIAIEFKDPSK